MIALGIPIIQEANTLIFRDCVKEPADLRITVYRHFICQKRMGKSKIRIVLSRVFLFYDQVRNKIQNQSSVTAKAFF